MTEFLHVLALYYACDVAAAIRPLPASEMQECMKHYRAVKAHFDEHTNVERYRAFKTWEVENAELVMELRGRKG